VIPKTTTDYKSPYDITDILKHDPNDRPWGPHHAFHYWSQPEWGYYLSDDEFVIRKHVQELSDAQVDVIILDATNGLVYTDVYMNLCRIFRQMRQEGQAAPQVCFMAHTNHDEVVPRLYEEFYSKGLYRELWFIWKGKPLLLSPPKGLNEQVLEYFTVRYCWAWSFPEGFFGDGKEKWTFFDHHPQAYGWDEDPNVPEQVSVTTAQHAHCNIGRSFHGGKQPRPLQQRPELGLCFMEQWQRALEVDPQFIMVIDWNEWTAMRFIHPDATSPAWEMFLG